MNSNEIRERFLSYFESQGHSRVASSSLIPVGDPTLLLTNAGMVQFKPYFSGEAKPPNRRLTSSQKSFRTVDIDEVGDATHLTMFEMLGNFSFGDYFKDGAMGFAVDCLESAMGLPRENFAATVHEGDDEAYDLWQKHGIPMERIYRFGDADNWWGPPIHGDEGPCGPCAELHYDFGDARPGCGLDDCGPNCENVNPDTGKVCQRYVELWNLVFMQFYRNPDGSLPPLPQTGIDTGMGLERLVVVLQGVEDIYGTDLFLPLICKVESITGHDSEESDDVRQAMRVVAEHGRSSAFLIADGVVPSNDGRGYVLRRLVRRAIRHARRLGMDEPFLGEIADAVTDIMGDAYPELRNNREFVQTVIKLEEERFLSVFQNGYRTLNGMIGYRQANKGALTELSRFAIESNPGSENAGRVLEQHGFVGYSPDAEEHERQGHEAAAAEFADGFFTALGAIEQGNTELIDSTLPAVASWGNILSGQEAFFLHDTYGFPVEMTQEIAAESGVGVDMEGFEQHMAEQRERARAGATFGADRTKIRQYESLGVGGVKFLGYESLVSHTVAVGMLSGGEVVGEVTEGDEVEIAIVETPFYPEGGGQVGDAGELVGPGGKIVVHDTQRVMPDLIMHFGKVVQGKVALGQPIDAYVDPVRREDTARNHTATHLLHAALREVLGAHVRQAGSLVAPDRLRFDFSHVEPVTPEEMRQIQFLVNEKIRHNATVMKSEDRYSNAIERGALAFFGDKYEDTVRLIEIANGATFSFEVCGGTHVARTGELGTVFVLGESSIGAGMRRIEATSGRGAERVVNERMYATNAVAAKLQTPVADIEGRIDGLLDELSQLRREKEALERKLSLTSASDLLERRQEVGGVSVLTAKVDAANVDSMREMGDWLRDKMGSGVVVLGAVINERPSLISMVTPDLRSAGLDAAGIVRGAAKVIGGGGGGRPDAAQAGGRDASKLDDALNLVPSLVKEQLDQA